MVIIGQSCNILKITELHTFISCSQFNSIIYTLKINLEKSKTVFHGVLRTVNRDEQDLECGGEVRGLRLKESKVGRWP